MPIKPGGRLDQIRNSRMAADVKRVGRDVKTFGLAGLPAATFVANTDLVNTAAPLLTGLAAGTAALMTKKWNGTDNVGQQMKPYEK